MLTCLACADDKMAKAKKELFFFELVSLLLATKRRWIDGQIEIS